MAHSATHFLPFAPYVTCIPTSSQVATANFQFVFSDLSCSPPILQATNHALKELGHPPIAEPEYNHLAGGGNQILLTNALRLSTGAPPTADDVRKAVALKMSFESARGEGAIKEFAGATEALNALSAGGLPLAVLSNKAEPLVREAVAHCFPRVQWAAVCGARDDTPVKPSAVAALRIVERHMPGVRAEDCAFVGDTSVDMQTGVAAGMFPVGVVWGFREEDELVRNGAKAIARERMDLVKILLEEGK